MIKELLILMFSLEISNSFNLTSFQQCTNDNISMKLGSPWNICVPPGNILETALGKRIPIWVNPDHGNKTKLSIIMDNLQILEIGSNAITLSMDMRVSWSEHRLIMNTPKMQTIYLSTEDQKKIWSPKIFIANNKVLENREREEFGFMKSGTDFIGSEDD